MNPKREQGGYSHFHPCTLLKENFLLFCHVWFWSSICSSVFLFCVSGSMASRSRPKSCGRNITSFWKSTRFATTEWTNSQLRDSTLPALPFDRRLNVGTILGLFKILFCALWYKDMLPIMGLMKLTSVKKGQFLKYLWFLRVCEAMWQYAHRPLITSHWLDEGDRLGTANVAGLKAGFLELSLHGGKVQC